MFFEFAVPTLGIVFLVIAPLVGWQKQRQRIEDSRRHRIMAHSAERASILAKSNMGSQTVSISGVVTLDDTVLIGYRKSRPTQGILGPGEKIDEHGSVNGTWVAWLSSNREVEIAKLQFWCNQNVSVVITVDPRGKDLHFIEPLTLDEVKILLAPA